MTLLNKTPQARKEALAYCRRCLAVMVCCVLVFGLTVPAAPKAKAAIVDGTSAVEIVGGPHLTVIKGGTSGGVETVAASATGSTFGAFLLAACGVDMLADSVEYSQTRYYGGTPYEKGNELWSYLYDLGGDIADWCMGVDTSSGAYGGINPGDSYSVPAEVAEAARQWALSNLNFAENNQLDFSNRVLFIDGQQIVLTVKPSNISLGWYKKLANLAYSGIQFGTLYNYVTSTRFSLSGTTDGWKWEYRLIDLDPASVMGNSDLLPYGDFQYLKNDKIIYSRGRRDTSYAFFWLDSYNGKTYLAPGLLDLEYGVLFDSSFRGQYLPISVGDIFSANTTFTKTSVLDQPKTEDITITIPKELPTTQVGELTIPIITEITSTDLESEPDVEPHPSIAPAPSIGKQDIKDAISEAMPDAIAEALPQTGSKVGDSVIDEVIQGPDDLGAVFISKFPFCIPWDIVKAIQLLAAPPVTPRWELDFMQPIAGRVGGFQGSTKLVLDFSDYPIVGVATRWVSTVLFVYALASGTKRLLWTA